MENLLTALKNFIPYNEQEEKDKAELLRLIPSFENIFSRENRQNHMTASSWIANKSRDKALMAYHNKGEYIPSHLHLNVTYLPEADETDTLFMKKDENSGVRWFLLDEAVRASSEPWFREHIYQKLNEKLRKAIKCTIFL